MLTVAFLLSGQSRLRVQRGLVGLGILQVRIAEGARLLAVVLSGQVCVGQGIYSLLLMFDLVFVS